MAVTRRFLIVGWKVKTGGGEVILRNYLSFLNDNPDDCSYVALVHDKALYEPVACPRVRLVQPGRLLQTNLAAPWMYHVVLPRLLKAWSIDGIFVFGGIPIPTSVPQLYLFQWPYAVYPHSPVWRRMDLFESDQPQDPCLGVSTQYPISLDGDRPNRDYGTQPLHHLRRFANQHRTCCGFAAALSTARNGAHLTVPPGGWCFFV